MLRNLVERLSGAVAGLALFGIMVLTFLDVSSRKAFSQSVPGSLELTELMMVLVIFAALPLVSLKGEHVVFDSLDRWLPAWLQRLQRGVVDLLCAVVMLAVAWVMWRKAGSLAQYGDTTAMLKISHAPFVYVMAALAAVTGLVHAVLVVAPHAAQEASACDDDAADTSAGGAT